MQISKVTPICNPIGYKKSKLGIIPEEWNIIKLRDGTKRIGSGVTPKGGESVYIDDGIPLIRSQNVLVGKLSLIDVAYISTEIDDQMKNTRLMPMDVLLNITGASIGRSCVVPKDLPNGNVNQHVCIIRTNEKLYPIYVVNFLNSIFGQKQIFSFQAGGNREGLNFNQIGSFIIPCPHYNEQKKIAEVLSTWDLAIEKTEALIKEKENLKKGLMQQLLTGKVRFKEFIEKEGFKDTKIGKVPEDWDIVMVKDFAKRNKNKVDPNEVDYKIKCIELEHIKQETGQLLGWTDIREQSSLKNQFCSSDILFGKLRPYLKKYWFATFNGACSSEIWVLQPKRQIVANFLYYLVQTQKFIRICNITSGTKMPRADWNIISSFHFPLPSISEQEKISFFMLKMDNEIDSLIKKLSQYHSQKKGLMQQLLTGKTRVKVDDT